MERRGRRRPQKGGARTVRRAGGEARGPLQAHAGPSGPPSRGGGKARGLMALDEIGHEILLLQARARTAPRACSNQRRQAAVSAPKSCPANCASTLRAGSWSIPERSHSAARPTRITQRIFEYGSHDQTLAHDPHFGYSLVNRRMQ
jgi:hypothetical protein